MSFVRRLLGWPDRHAPLGLCSWCRLMVYRDDDYIEHHTGYSHERCILHRQRVVKDLTRRGPR